MPSRVRTCALCVFVAGLGAPALGGIGYLTQDRSIFAATSADGNAQTRSAPGFGAFSENLNLSAPFETLDGGTGVNAAEVGIDCQLDPNAIVFFGSLVGAGGMSLVNGVPTLQFGEVAINVSVGFQLDVAMPFVLSASRRPSDNPGDRFKIKLKDPNGNFLVDIDQDMPAQALFLSGALVPGEYSLEYEAQFLVEGPETLRDLSFNMTVPAPGSVGVLMAMGGRAVRRRR